jgi:tetratricopeptide (TPR) repeat protein
LEKELRDKIKKNPGDPMNYYYLAKDLMKKPLKDIYSVKEIEGLLKKSIEIKPQLWAPKIALGELMYKLGRFSEAEPYFKESLKNLPESESVKAYLMKCVSKKSEPYGNNQLSKQDSLYVFENNVREFIRTLLEENYYEEWWRKGVPQKIRASCAARREEGLDEEKEADLLLFADFHDYRIIIESNKNIFSSYIDTKEWCKNLSEMEPIRNAIAHNRPLTVAPIRVREYSMTFSKILDKIKNKN